MKDTSAGVEKGGKGLLDTIGEVAGNAWDGFCNFFGIKSPSKLFEEAGEYMMEGASIGVDANRDELAGSLEHAGKVGADAFTNSFPVEKATVSVKKFMKAGEQQLVDSGEEFSDTAEKVGEEEKKDIQYYLGLLGGALGDTVGELDWTSLFGGFGSSLTDSIGEVEMSPGVDMSELYEDLDEVAENDNLMNPVMTPVADMSNVEQTLSNFDYNLGGTDLSDMMSSTTGAASSAYSSYDVSGYNQNGTGAYGYSGTPETVNNNTFNNTFNIMGPDPEVIADEVARILRQRIDRKEATWA